MDAIFQQKLRRWLEDNWNIKPCNLSLYETALTLDKYENYEYLGDALLDFIIADILLHTFPLKDPKWFTNKRTTIVSNKNLYDIAQKLNVVPFILYPKNNAGSYNVGIKTLSDIIEALIGAIYLDLGLNATVRSIRTIFQLDTIQDDVKIVELDPQGFLLTWIAERKFPKVEYEVRQLDVEKFETFAKFTVGSWHFEGTGIGRTLKESRKECDRQLLKWLQKNDNEIRHAHTIEETKNSEYALQTLHYLLQKYNMALPEYTIVQKNTGWYASGSCIWNGRKYTGCGFGHNKKEAKNQVALMILKDIQ